MECHTIVFIPVETWQKKCTSLSLNLTSFSKAGNKSRDVSSRLQATSVDGH